MDQDDRLSLAAANDTLVPCQAAGGTAPFVRTSISIARAKRGRLEPLRHLVTVGRETGGLSIAANSSSLCPRKRRYSSRVMTAVCIIRTIASTSFCAKSAVADPRGQRDTRSMANRLKIIRRKKKLSQEALAERLGLSHSTIQRLENGIIELTESRVYELAKALDVKPWEILGDAEAEKHYRALERVMDVVDGMTNEQLETWIKLGSALRTSSDKAAS